MEDHTAGYWQYHDYNLPVDANNFILVEWTKCDNGNGSVKFINNSDNPEWADEKDDYIEYKRIEDDIEVNFYDVNYIYRTNNTLSIKVFWNFEDGTGGISPNEDNVEEYEGCSWDFNE